MGAGGEVPRKRGCHTRSAPGLREGDPAGPERAEPEGQRLEARLGLPSPQPPPRVRNARIPSRARAHRSEPGGGRGPRDVTNGAAKGRGPCSARPSAPPTAPSLRRGSHAQWPGRVRVGAYHAETPRGGCAGRPQLCGRRDDPRQARELALEMRRTPPPVPSWREREQGQGEPRRGHFFPCLSPPTALVAQPGRARRRTRVRPGGAGSWRRVPR